MVKITENKLDNLEHSISRIEETSQNIPDLEKKIKYLKEDYNHKIEILNYCSEYIENQFTKTFMTLSHILSNDDDN